MGQHSSCTKVSRAVPKIFPCMRENLPYPVIAETCLPAVCYHSIPILLHCCTVLADFARVVLQLFIYTKYSHPEFNNDVWLTVATSTSFILVCVIVDRIVDRRLLK